MSETFLVVIAILFLITGFFGSFLPVLPGPPLGFAGMLILHFTQAYHFATTVLVVFGLVAVILIILDYVLPVYGTKKSRGSKRGATGATIGLIVGLFILPPMGIFIGPFIGALIGELTTKKEFSLALKAATGTFLGLLAGTLLKMGFTLAAIIVSLVEIF